MKQIEIDACNGQIDQNIDIETLPFIRTTRYGCNAGNWNQFE